MVHATDFSVIMRNLYNIGTDEILYRYVLEFEHASILTEGHGGVAGGHYAGREIAQNILRVRL